MASQETISLRNQKNLNWQFLMEFCSIFCGALFNIKSCGLNLRKIDYNVIRSASWDRAGAKKVLLVQFVSIIWLEDFFSRIMGNDWTEFMWADGFNRSILSITTLTAHSGSAFKDLYVSCCEMQINDRNYILFLNVIAANYWLFPK